MKFCFFLSLIFLVACTPTVNKEDIHGSWTTIEIGKFANDAMTDRVTFDENGEIAVEYFLNGNTIEKIKGKYSIDGRVLTTIYDTTKISFIIHELTEKNFVARQDGAKVVLRLRKIQQ